MKKLFLVLAFSGMVAGVSASTVSTLTNSGVVSILKDGDDKDKKKDKKSCSKEKSCCKKDGEKKSCCKKGEKSEEKK